VRDLHEEARLQLERGVGVRQQQLAAAVLDDDCTFSIFGASTMA